MMMMYTKNKHRQVLLASRERMDGHEIFYIKDTAKFIEVTLHVCVHLGSRNVLTSYATVLPVHVELVYTTNINDTMSKINNHKNTKNSICILYI